MDIVTIQIVSVPYALYAKNVENKEEADADSVNELQILSFSIDTLMIKFQNASDSTFNSGVPGLSWYVTIIE